MSAQISPRELTLLQSLAQQFPSTGEALAEAAALRASLLLPKGVVHIVSDVHGEYKKLRHIINNASGSLRPLVESLFRDRLTEEELHNLLSVLYYPHESMEYLSDKLKDAEWRQSWVMRTLGHQFEIVRELARSYRRSHVLKLVPPAQRELFEELLAAPATESDNPTMSENDPKYLGTMIATLASRDADLAAVRAASHLVRNLSVAELIVAGDLGDRGPRTDRVIAYLMEQPNVAFTWGNHDASWLGACLGQEALIATVLRISLRYRRLSQLEEGYGLIITPVEKLARTVYADDPVERFQTKGKGLRDDLLMARMQKAIAIIQFKLEGQTSRRHPEWDLEHRNLLHRINHEAGTVEIDGKSYPMLDTHLPTIDPKDPYALSPEERTCMDRMRESFVSSARLWEHMRYVARNGAMWLVRDHNVIFHGCAPVTADGAYESLVIDGQPRAGREMFAALDSLVRRAFRHTDKINGADPNEKDWFWYLWTGPRSPLFGKDRMATFETYFVADKATHKETKNPYFSLIHDAEFCRRVMIELENAPDKKSDPTEAKAIGPGDGIIVNGHVPVKIEQGEAPVKRGGNAVTIDGAFSEAYGDHGFTLVLAPDRIALAEHHHFESIAEAITSGADIIPKVTTIRSYSPPRTIGDTEAGDIIRERIAALDQLIQAYDEGLIPEALTRSL